MPASRYAATAACGGTFGRGCWTATARRRRNLEGVAKSYVLSFTWEEPSDGALATAVLDRGLVDARDRGARVKLRILAGVDSPAWAKRLGGSPIGLRDDHDGASGTVPRFWTPAFGAACTSRRGWTTTPTRPRRGRDLAVHHLVRRTVRPVDVQCRQPRTFLKAWVRPRSSWPCTSAGSAGAGGPGRVTRSVSGSRHSRRCSGRRAACCRRPERVVRRPPLEPGRRGMHEEQKVLRAPARHLGWPGGRCCPRR
jgi:hypothetical protein